MFLCRAGRLSAAALDQAFKSPGSFLVRVKANRLKHDTVTLSLRGHTAPCCRALCARSPLTHLGKQLADPHPVQHRGESSSPPPSPLLSGFIITDWGHRDRVATVAVNLLRRSGNLDITSPPLDQGERRCRRRGEPGGLVLFTGNGGVSGRRCLTRTMHTRASSTAAAAAKKSEEERATGSDKGDEPNVKEAFTVSSSTEKAPGEAEPEGGKPNKTQQLKKVFKEYGAVGVSFHICISLMSLGMFYLLISSGIDMAAILCKLGFSESVVRSKMAAGTSTFVLAYAIHKLFAPLRISITLVSVPLIVRYFRKTGLFKPPTPAP